MARSVSWASLSSRSGSSMSSCKLMAHRGSSTAGGSSRGPEIEAHERPLGVRQIADDLLHRRGQFAHERRDRKDLIARRELRVLEQVDDLDAVLPCEVLVAQALEIGDSDERSSGLSS